SLLRLVIVRRRSEGRFALAGGAQRTHIVRHRGLFHGRISVRRRDATGLMQTESRIVEHGDKASATIAATKWPRKSARYGSPRATARQPRPWRRSGARSRRYSRV